MEEWNHKLDFDSIGIQCQTVKKICQSVKQRRIELIGASPLITAKTPKIDALELLWSKCRDGSPRQKALCSHALIELWEDNVLQEDYILQRFVNLLPTTQSVQPCVDAVGKLLLMMVKKALYGVMGSGDEVVPESRHYFHMRKNPHPFISMYKSRPTCWSFLLETVSSLLSQEDDRLQVEILHILKPFMRYVLLDPLLDPKQGSMRVLLTESLAQASRPSIASQGGSEEGSDQFSNEVLKFLLECMPCMPIATNDAITEAAHILTIAMGIISRNHPGIDIHLVGQAVHCCLSLAHQLNEKGLGMCTVLQPLAELKSDQLDFRDSSVIAMIGSLLLVGSIQEQNLLLRFALKYTGSPARTLRSKTQKLLVWSLIQVMDHLHSRSTIELKSLEVSERKENRQMAYRLFTDITANHPAPLIEREDDPENEKCKFHGLHPWYNTMSVFQETSLTILSNENVAHNWLHRQQAKVHSGIGDNDNMELTIQLSVAILFSFGQQLANLCIDLLIDIGNAVPSKAYNMMPLLMLVITRMKQPSITECLMKALPRLVGHRYLIGPVFRLVVNQNLNEMSLKLVTDLWKKQDRIFPELQKKLAECEKMIGKLNPLTGLDNMLLEIAVCISEVCSERPEQHGEDMVQSISMVLKKATGPAGVPATCYALDALISITRAEVVDIVTAYKWLAGQFQDEKRPMVLAKWCEFMGLAPELTVETKPYEVFTRAVIHQLWHLTEHPNHRVVSEALSALAGFKASSFNINHLPKEATRKVQAKRAHDRKKRAEARIARGEEEEDEEEDLSIPGSCFLNLLSCMNQDASAGKEELLHSFLCDELDNLPRRYYAQSSPRQSATESNSSKHVSIIPSAISQKNQNNKQPGLRPSYAAGLLFSFKPGCESSRDAKKARKNRTALSQVCLDTLTLLLNEVPVSTSDWFYIMELPRAWASFMSTALVAVIEGRRSDVEHTASRRRDGLDEEALQEGLASAWLWARDQLTEQLRTTVLKNSNAKANAVLALAGLAHAVSAYVIQLGEEATTSQRSASQYEGHKSWMARVVDSLQVAMDPTHSVQSVFKFCQHQSRDHSQTISKQMDSCAALGLPLLASHLMTMPISSISQVIDQMMSLSSADPSQSVLYGVGVGMLLSRLCAEHFTDMTGAEGEKLLFRFFDKLENTALNQNNNPEDDVIGAMLGLGMALSGLAHESTTHAKVHVLKIRDDLLRQIENTTDVSSLLTQAQVLSLSLVTAACYQVNYISSQDAFSTANILQSLAQQNLKCIPLAVGAGLLMHSLMALRHPDVVPLYNNQQAVLLRHLNDKESNSEMLKSSVAGLVALLVGPNHLVQTNQKADLDHRGLGTAVKMLCQLLSDTSDLKLQHSLPWQLGYLYMGSSGVTEARSSVPATYSNMEESSLLREAVEVLIVAGRHGSEVVPSQHVLILLKTLYDCSESCKRALPPLNWAVILNPIMRNNSYANNSIYCECMKLAVGQCAWIKSAALQGTASFVASWLTPSVYQTIKESCESYLFQRLHILVSCLPLKTLEVFMNSELVSVFQNSNMQFNQCINALLGLKLAAQVQDPAQGVVNLLMETAQKIFNILPFDKEYHCLLLAHFADFINHLPMTFLEDVTAVQGNLLKASFIRCHLVKQGLQPVQWLSDCVDEAMNDGSESDQSNILWLLLIALGQTPSKLPVQEKEGWLEKLKNHLKTLAFGRGTTTGPLEPFQRTNFLHEVFSLSIVAWASFEFNHICGPHPHHNDSSGTFRVTDQSAGADGGEEEELSSTSDCESIPDWLEQVNENSPLGCGEYGRQTLRRVRSFLPGALYRLVQTPPWDGMKGKMIEWLINMGIDSNKELVTESVRTDLKGCLYAIRHFGEFSKDSRWIKVFDQ